MSTTANNDHRFDDRTRFNWGFHDATADKAEGREKRRRFGSPRPLPEHDPAYRAGYAFGYESISVGDDRPDSSEPAWLKYQDEQNAPA